MHAEKTADRSPPHTRDAPRSRGRMIPSRRHRRSGAHLRARHARTRRRRCVRALPRARLPASPTRARVEPGHLALGPRSEARHPRRMACRMSMSPSKLRASAGYKFGVSGAEIEVIRDAAVGGEDRRDLASGAKDGGATVAAAISDQCCLRRHRKPHAKLALGLGFVRRSFHRP